MERRPALTVKQQRVLETIRQARRKTGQGPTVREIADACGVSSTCTAQRHIDALERKGYVTRQTYAYRSLRVVGEDRETCCPTCGRAFPGE